MLNVTKTAPRSRRIPVFVIPSALLPFVVGRLCESMRRKLAACLAQGKKKPGRMNNILPGLSFGKLLGRKTYCFGAPVVVPVAEGSAGTG